MNMTRLLAVLMVGVFCLTMVVAPVAAAEKKTVKADEKAAEKVEKKATAEAEGGVIQVKGIIVDYDLKASTVTVKIDGKDMVFHVENKKAMGKLETRLFPDDEVKINYIVKDGKNIIKGKSDLMGTKPGC